MASQPLFKEVPIGNLARFILRRPRFVGSVANAAGFLLLCQQHFDLPPQVCVASARQVEECLARFSLTLLGGMEELLYSAPAFLLSGDPLLAV
jgi:hypothetical protein